METYTSDGLGTALAVSGTNQGSVYQNTYIGDYPPTTVPNTNHGYLVGSTYTVQWPYTWWLNQWYPWAPYTAPAVSEKYALAVEILKCKDAPASLRAKAAKVLAERLNCGF